MIFVENSHTVQFCEVSSNEGDFLSICCQRRKVLFTGSKNNLDKSLYYDYQ